MQTFNEATVLALMVSARKEGRFAHPVIVQKGTNVMIDGFHRTEAVSRLAAEGLDIYLGLDEYETDDPAGLAQDINKTRRSWTTEEERRTQVQFLATQTDAEGRSFTNQQIADAVGDICEATVRSDKSKAATSQNYEVAVPPATRSKGKDGRSYSPPATEAEKAKAWAMKDSGMSNAAIAKDLDRPARTISGWFSKGRPEAVAIGQPVMPEPVPDPAPAPASAPEPAPSVPSAGSSEPFQWADHPRLKGWNGSLNERGQKIYNREVRSSRSRVRMAEQLAEFKVEIEKSMKAASNNHRNGGGWALLEADVAMVEATLQREERPGIKETLEAVMHEAERIQKYASETLRVLQLTKTLQP